MSLRLEIQTIEGEYASLGKVIYTALILMEYRGNKVMDGRNIQDSICMFFSNAKLDFCIKSATRNVLQFCKDNILPENFGNIKNKIKELMRHTGIKKITPTAILYLNSIYDNIDHYEQEAFAFETTYTLDYFIKNCIILMNVGTNLKITDKHYELMQRILSPNNPITIVWDVERTKDNVVKVMDKYKPYYKLTDSFYNRIIYNFTFKTPI